MIFFPHFFSKRIWLIGITSLLSLGIFFWFHSTKNSETSTTTKTVTVERGDIQETIKVVGTAELVNEQKLRFNQTGKVVSVYFSDGKAVKQGQVIAELDKSNYDNDIKQGQVALENAQITLKNLLEGNKQSQIDKAQNSLSQTQNSIVSAKKNLTIEKQKYSQTVADLTRQLNLAKKDKDNKSQALDAAQKKLASTSASETQNVSSAETSNASTLKNAFLEAGSDFVSIKDLLSSTNSLLGIEGQAQHINDNFESLISALNSDYKSQTESSYRNTQTKLTAVESQYKNLKAQESVSQDEVLQLIESTKIVLESAVDTANGLYNVAANTISGTNLTQSSIDSYKSSASSSIKSLQSNLDSLETQITKIKNLQASTITELASESTLIQAQNSVKNAELDLEKAKQNVLKLETSFESDKEAANLLVVKAENDLNNLENTLQANQQELKELKDGSDVNDIAKARNDITQKELALEKSKSNIDNYQIIAPFDGIVRKIDYKPGDKIVQDDDKFVYIENPDLMKIDISLDQIDIVKTEVGQKAKIIFDAFPDKTFDGVIEEVDQTPQTSSGVVSYTVSLTLNKGESKVYSGMTATVNIIVKEAKNVLLVPTSAISSRKGKNIVRKEGEKVPTEVEIGVSDGKHTEIIKGLNEGESILEQELVIPSNNQQKSGIGGLGGMGGGAFGGGGNRGSSGSSGGSGRTGG